MAEELNIITSDVNTVDVNTEDRTVVITNESDTTTVTLSAAQTTVIQIATIGPKGDKGDIGNIDVSTLATTGSNTFIGNQIVTGSINLTNGITGSLLGTASFATTASYALNAGAGAGFPYSGSAVITGSLLVTEGITGSFSGSVFGYVSNEATASFVTNQQTASFATTSSLNSLTNDFTAFTASTNQFTQSILSWTGSVVTNTIFNSFTQSYNTGSFLGNLEGTASWASNYIETDPIYTAEKAKYLTTGSSNTTQTISGSLVINQNLTVLGSQSVQYITSSQLNIQTNLITVNTATPAVRFGGLAVYDSGSTGTGLTGSLLWDSEHNVWIYTNPSGSEYDGGMLLTGPRNTGGIGYEVGINRGYTAVGDGSHHMTSSAIYSSESIIRLENNTWITGSLNVSNGITGSFSGSVFGYVPNTATSSFVPNTATSSFVQNNQTSSFATTGSNVFRGNQTITGSLTVSGSTIITGSLNVSAGVTASLFGTSSWATSSLTASTADNFTIRGNLIVSGNTTIGDATTDSITMTAATMSLGGNLNIDSNTLFVDGGTNRVGIGKVPTTTLDISGTTSITGSFGISGSLLVTQSAASVAGGRNSILSLSNNLDIAMNNTSGERGIRIFATSSLTPNPGGAAIQFFSADNVTFPGQFFIDSAAHNNAAIIFRTAQSAGTITERMRISSNGNVGIGTNSPQNKLDVVRGTSGSMGRGYYEVGSFSYDADTKIGFYNAESSIAGGVSLLLGKTNATTTNDGTYPGFEFQMTPNSNEADNFVRYNYIGRNPDGQVVNYAADIIDIYADGRIIINPTVGGATITANPKLGIGTNTPTQALDVSGSVNVYNLNKNSEIYIDEAPVSPAINIFNHINFT